MQKFLVVAILVAVASQMVLESVLGMTEAELEAARAKLENDYKLPSFIKDPAQCAREQQAIEQSRRERLERAFNMPAYIKDEAQRAREQQAIDRIREELGLERSMRQTD